MHRRPPTFSWGMWRRRKGQAASRSMVVLGALGVAVCAGSIALAAGTGGTTSVGQASPMPVATKMDPQADQLLLPETRVDVIKAEGFAFLEGPVWVRDGQYLLFSDMPANCIYKWDGKQVSVFMEKSGFTGTDPSTAGMEVNNGRFQVIVLGSNGLTVDPDGNLVIAQHGNRQVVRINKDGTQTVLAREFEGKRINSSNDLVFKSNGSLYFSDPPTGLRGFDKSPLKELPFDAVFLVKDGKMTVVEKNPQGVIPNGLALSPDEKILYLTARRKVVAYDIKADDTLENPRVVFNYDDHTSQPGGFDGMKVDSKGNIWGPGPGGIWAVSPAGKPLLKIALPEAAANLAFGDSDGKTLYVVGHRGLYRIRVNVAGIIP